MEDLNYFVGTQSGSRLLASIIDNLIAMIFCFIIGFSLIKILNYFNIESPILIIVFSCFIYLLYFFVMESLWSKTVGKMFTGLEIINKDGGAITVSQALIRTIFRIIEVNPFLLGAIPAALFILFSNRKQRIGDMLAGTVVNFK